MAASAYAGHAGEVSGQAMMPHELVGFVVVLALLVIVLAMLTALAFWRLRVIDRRVRQWEQKLAAIRPEAPSTHQRS
jgi:hypothetical protein